MIGAVLLRLLELDWDAAVRIAAAETAILKYGFNPNEPRDSHGRWTEDGSGTELPSEHGGSTPPDVTDVAYPGSYHDQFTRQYADYLRSIGATVIKEVWLTGVNGATTRADLVVLLPGMSKPIVIEVKTGENPKFTPAQQSVYPLTAVGGHVTSRDPRIATVGLIPGKLLPPLDVWFVYKFGPGSPLVLRKYAPEFLP